MNGDTIVLDAPARRRPRLPLRWPRAALGLLLPAGALLAAEAGVRSGLIAPNLLPALQNLLGPKSR